MNNLYRLAGFIIVLLFDFSISTAQIKSEIKSLDGVPSLFINGQPHPPYAYMSYLGESKYYKEIEETGIHLYCFPVYLGDRGINAASGIGPFRTPVWIGYNQYDFSSITVDFEKIIQSDSKAKIIIRLHLDPPLWWEKLNPDASTQLPDGTTFRQSFYSDKWREETGKALEDCILWLMDSPYSKYILGIHVAAGATEEWFYHSPQYDDRNPIRLNAFREWLKKKYDGSNSAFQKAWNNDQVVFETAKIGNVLEKATPRWRRPEKEQNIIDTYEFHAETLVENIKFFCKIVKETSNKSLLTGVFYGYHYYVSDPRRGHGALSKLLECDDLDYLSSPNVYNRVIGEDWPPMVAIQSVQMHGKLWLAENDTRTSITTLLKEKAPEIAPPGQYESGVWLGPEDMKTSISFLWKNAGRMLTQGYGGWWFDMWGGWFSDHRLLSVIKKTNQFFTKYPQNIGLDMQPEVCVIVDEQLHFWDASYGELTEQILSNRYPLARTGAPHDLFLRTDIENILTDQYKVIWLMGFLDLNDKEKQKINQWQKQGITVLWTDGNGTHKFSAAKSDYIDNFKQFTDSQLRDIFKNAGVHIYIDSGDLFYIGRNWLCIHSVFGGNKKINLPFSAEVINAKNDKKYSDLTNIIEIDMTAKSTLLFRVNPR